MSVAHLEGKRTGRPKGAKSTPPWVRDLRRAYKNLANPEADAPSEMAARLLVLGRVHPDRLLAALLMLNAPEQKMEAPAEAAGVLALPEPPAPPRRIKTLMVPMKELALWLLGRYEPAWLRCLPNSFVVEGCIVNVQRQTMALTIWSRMFDPVPEGEPIPRIEWD